MATPNERSGEDQVRRFNAGLSDRGEVLRNLQDLSSGPDSYRRLVEKVDPRGEAGHSDHRDGGAPPRMSRLLEDAARGNLLVRTIEEERNILASICAWLILTYTGKQEIEITDQMLQEIAEQGRIYTRVDMSKRAVKITARQQPPQYASTKDWVGTVTANQRINPTSLHFQGRAIDLGPVSISGNLAATRAAELASAFGLSGREVAKIFESVGHSIKEFAEAENAVLEAMDQVRDVESRMTRKKKRPRTRRGRRRMRQGDIDGEMGS